jgi:hypothetical protein
MKIELINNTLATLLLKVWDKKNLIVQLEILPGIVYNLSYLEELGDYITFHKENIIGKYIFNDYKYWRFPFRELNNWNKFIEIK